MTELDVREVEVKLVNLFIEIEIDGEAKYITWSDFCEKHYQIAPAILVILEQLFRQVIKEKPDFITTVPEWFKNETDR